MLTRLRATVIANGPLRSEFQVGRAKSVGCIRCRHRSACDPFAKHEDYVGQASRRY
jgi:hypothetical protein